MKNKNKIGNFSTALENKILTKISNLSEKFSNALDTLERDLDGYDSTWSAKEKATYCRDKLVKDMAILREYADKMELIMGKEFNPYPSYEEILYSVKY